MRKLAVLFLLFVFFGLGQQALAQKSAGVAQPKISINPSFVFLKTGGRYGDYNSGGWMQFRALVDGQDQVGNLDWTINGLPLGNAEIGHLTGYEGDYITPSFPPAQQYVTLRATSKSNPANYGEAKILIVDAPRRYRVLLDLSHSFLFVWHNASVNLLNGAFETTATLQRSLRAKLLESYDVVVIQNGHTDVQFLDYEIEALVNFVAGGGGLLLLSNHQAPVEAMNQLAERFGLNFGSQVLAKKFSKGRFATIGDVDFISGDNPKNKEIFLRTVAWLSEKLSENLQAQNLEPLPRDAGCDNRLPVPTNLLNLENVPVQTEICIADSMLAYYPPALNLFMQKI